MGATVRAETSVTEPHRVLPDPADLAAPRPSDPTAGVQVTLERLGYRPALDGLRGIAVLAVVLNHAGLLGFAGGGGFGVSLFFVLSGFLITTLLVEERRASGAIDLRRFYGRRIRRLLPALVVLGVVFTIAGFIAGRGVLAAGQALVSVAYVGNWARILELNVGGLQHTWSLAIEEQFYLVWPLALTLLTSRGRILWVVGGLAVASVALQQLVGGGERAYLGSDTRAFDLLAGVGLALLFTSGRRIRPPRWLQAAALLALPLMIARIGPEWYFDHVALGLWALVAGVMVAAAINGWRWLASPVLVWVGGISYALYLWHYPLYYPPFDLFAGSPLRMPLIVGLSFVLAWASTRFIEAPFRGRSAALPEGRARHLIQDRRIADGPRPARVLEDHDLDVVASR